MTPAEKVPGTPQRPSLARFVLYRTKPEGDGFPEDRAALVNSLEGDGFNVGLTVFHPTNIEFVQGVPYAARPFNDLPEPGTWRWPERV